MNCIFTKKKFRTFDPHPPTVFFYGRLSFRSGPSFIVIVIVTNMQKVTHRLSPMVTTLALVLPSSNLRCTLQGNFNLMRILNWMCFCASDTNTGISIQYLFVGVERVPWSFFISKPDIFNASCFFEIGKRTADKQMHWL